MSIIYLLNYVKMTTENSVEWIYYKRLDDQILIKREKHMSGFLLRTYVD